MLTVLKTVNRSRRKSTSIGGDALLEFLRSTQALISLKLKPCNST